jgi:hypothetical protein
MQEVVLQVDQDERGAGRGVEVHGHPCSPHER